MKNVFIKSILVTLISVTAIAGKGTLAVDLQVILNKAMALTKTGGFTFGASDKANMTYVINRVVGRNQTLQVEIKGSTTRSTANNAKVNLAVATDAGPNEITRLSTEAGEAVERLLKQDGLDIRVHQYDIDRTAWGRDRTMASSIPMDDLNEAQVELVFQKIKQVGDTFETAGVDGVKQLGRIARQSEDTGYQWGN
jgi:hypothetical protein